MYSRSRCTGGSTSMPRSERVGTMRGIDTCMRSSVLLGAPRFHDPRAHSHSIRYPAPPIANPILQTRPPILKGASPLLRRWAFSVGAVSGIPDSATANHKNQPGRWWRPRRAAAQISTWTGSWFSRTRQTWFTGTIVRAGRFGRLPTAALASANAV